MVACASCPDHISKAAWLAAIPLLCGLPGAAAMAAARLEYSFEASMLYDDNVHLTESAQDGDEILIPRLLFNFADDSAKLKADVAGDLSYYHYLRGNFGDDFRGTLAGTALWHLLPERIDWVFEDYLGRQPINVLLDNTPDNQQQTNFFVTGPSFKLHLGDRMAGRIDLRYSNSYAEKTTEFNGNRFSALAAAIHEIDANSSLSVNAQGQRVSYDSTVQTLDYNRQDIYAGYVLQGAHSHIELDAGYSWLEFRHHGGSDSGPLLRGSFRLEPSPRSSFTVSVLRGFSDAAQDLIMNPAQVGNVDIGSGLGNMLVSPQAYTETRIDFTYEFHVERYRFSIAPYWRKLAYVSAFDFNETARGGYGQFTYQLTPRMSFAVYAGAERRQYSTLNRTDDDRRFGLQLACELTRHWQWRVQLQELERSTTAAGLGYTDHQLLFALRYAR